MNIDEMISVLQAAKAGKPIQFKVHDGGWADVDNTPDWNFSYCDYREKIVPRVVYFNEYPDGHVGPAYKTYGEAMQNGNHGGSVVKFVEEIE